MKLFKYLGIYTACVIIYKTLDYCSEPIDIMIHEAFNKKFNPHNKPNKSINISEKSIEKTINKIGF